MFGSTSVVWAEEQQSEGCTWCSIFAFFSLMDVFFVAWKHQLSYLSLFFCCHLLQDERLQRTQPGAAEESLPAGEAQYVRDFKMAHGSSFPNSSSSDVSASMSHHGISPYLQPASSCSLICTLHLQTYLSVSGQTLFFCVSFLLTVGH